MRETLRKRENKTKKNTNINDGVEEVSGAVERTEHIPTRSISGIGRTNSEPEEKNCSEKYSKKRKKKMTYNPHPASRSPLKI